MATNERLYSVADTLSSETSHELDRIAAQAPRHLGRRLAGETKYYSRLANTYVHEHYWMAACAAVMSGFFAGMLLNRRC